MPYQGRQSFGFRCAIRTTAGDDAVKAALTKGTSDSKIVFTAKSGGTGGNSISVEAIDPGTDAALAVSVIGNVITIDLGYSSSAIDSTVNDVIAAIYANADAAALIDVTNGDGDGTGVLAAFAEASLVGGTAATHVFTDIPGIQDVDVPGLGRTALDFTSHSSEDGYAEYGKSKVKDGRSFTLPIKYDPQNAAHQALKSAEASDDPTVMRFYFSQPGADFENDVLVLDAPISNPVRDLLMMNVSCQLTGAPTLL